MQKQTVIEKQVVLTLNQEDVNWLFSVVQNPINGETLEDECRYNAQMRRMFFDALKGEVQ